jgi:hypothetical protein
MRHPSAFVETIGSRINIRQINHFLIFHEASINILIETTNRLPIIEVIRGDPRNEKEAMFKPTNDFQPQGFEIYHKNVTYSLDSTGPPTVACKNAR